MKKLFVILVVTLGVALLNGCSLASFSTKAADGVESYKMEGTTRHPALMARTLSENHVRELSNAEYWRAVRTGQAYPLPGGMYGDFGFYFDGFLPPVVPVMQPVQGTQSDGTSLEEVKKMAEEAKKKANEAHERATDGLKMHKRLRDAAKK